jgi:hypothetical protein
MYIICECHLASYAVERSWHLLPLMLLLIGFNLLSSKGRVIYNKRTVPRFQTCLTYFL